MSKQEFIEAIAMRVKRYAASYGIKCHSAIIAQAILESGWGNSKLASTHHNYFGLKCGTKWTGPSVNMSTQEEYTPGVTTNITDNFRVYESMDEGVKGYFEFIQLPRYRNLKGITDPKQYLDTIKEDGYATSSAYVVNTYAVVTQYNLTEYDNNGGAAVMGRTAQDYLAIWRGWIGFSEANGKFKQIVDLYNSVRPLPRGYAVQYYDEWCDTTVSAAAIASNVVDLIGRECGCEEHVKIFKALGIWIEDGTITPKPGYIILYNWDKAAQPNDGYSDHIGVVESVSGGQITCIEGNKGETVARRVLSVGNGYIRGYASPKFAKSSGGSGSSTNTPSAPSTPENINKTVAWKGVVNTADLNVRTWAGTENGQLKSYPTISQGTEVGVCDTVNTADGSPWYYICISGNQGEKYGFVAAMYITKKNTSAPTAGTGSGISKVPQWTGKVTADILNVRTWAGVNNPIIKSWPQIACGNLVDVCDTVNAADGSPWYYIRIDGRIYGFVHSAYIKKV